MDLKSITSIFDGHDYEDRAVMTAIALANALEAFVDVVHVSYTVASHPATRASYPLIGAAWGPALDAHSAKMTEAARERADTFLAEADGSSGRGAFTHIEGPSNQALARRLSLSDLIVIGMPNGSADLLGGNVANLALFATDRPVLVVRPTEESLPAPIIAERCLVAWNDSVEAARALLNALPLLRCASAVHLITVTQDSTADLGDDQRLARKYLERHGISVETELIESQENAADQVIERAHELGCSFLVSGAYGQNVFREYLLDGFTEHLIRNANLPLLLSH